MIKTLTSVLLALVFAGPAGAHDFWLQPETFRMNKPGQLVVQALVGHSDDLSVWYTAPSRIISFNSVGPDGVTDQQSMLGADPAKGTLRPALPVPGLHILALASTNSVSDLPATQCLDLVELHDASHAIVATSLANLAKIQKYARRAINATAGCVRSTNVENAPGRMLHRMWSLQKSGVARVDPGPERRVTTALRSVVTRLAYGAIRSPALRRSLLMADESSYGSGPIAMLHMDTPTLGTNYPKSVCGSYRPKTRIGSTPGS